MQGFIRSNGFSGYKSFQQLMVEGRTASARNPAPARSTRAVLEVKKFCSIEDAADPADLSRLDIPMPD